MSVKGLGRAAPDPKNSVTLCDGVVVPMGPAVYNDRPGYSLKYNEYVVYDISHIRIRYLLRTKFNYKVNILEI